MCVPLYILGAGNVLQLGHPTGDDGYIFIFPIGGQPKCFKDHTGKSTRQNNNNTTRDTSKQQWT